MTMKTSAVLNFAADALEERGWTVGSDGWNSGDRGPLCLEGAIQAALNLDWNSFASEEQMKWEEFKVCPAYIAVQEYLDLVGVERRDGKGPELWRWNDEVADDPSQVVRVLRAAALIEAAKEAKVEATV